MSNVRKQLLIMTTEDMFTVHKSLLSGESWFCINLESQSKLFLIIEKKGCHTSPGVLNLEMFMLFQFLILYLCNLLPSGKNLWIEAPLHKKTLQAQTTWFGMASLIFMLTMMRQRCQRWWQWYSAIKSSKLTLHQACHKICNKKGWQG